jgi:hypothetical protein
VLARAAGRLALGKRERHVRGRGNARDQGLNPDWVSG